MNRLQKRVLVHHHAVAHIDKGGIIWLPSFIGRWIDALAPLVGEIGLLLHQSTIRTPRQDEQVRASNVRLWSLGEPGGSSLLWLERIKRMRRVCRAASSAADVLLIRGVTPHQQIVWNATQVNRKAYLLVGSLKGNRLLPQLSPMGIYGWVRTKLRPRQIRYMAKRDTLMLANSPVLATELRQLTGGPATFVPTNSIRASEFAPFDCRPIGAKPHLLYCGRVTAEKGIRELIEALALPAAQNYELEIVGPAISQEQASFVALAHQLGVSSRVTWHGPVSYGHALFRFFQRADIFVLPSYHEGFPHVIWEAAANCCPVIATRVGGIPGLWTHDTHGMLIAPRSAEEIVRAVNRLQADSDLHEKIVKNAYLHAQEYDVEACAERLVEVLIETWN